MKKLFVSLLVMVAALVTQGCAPGLGRELPVTRFREPSEIRPREIGRARILVKPFSDGRADHSVAMIDGRSVSPATDVGASVRAAMEANLKAAGFGIGGIDSPSISGTVQRWMVQVYPGFPTSRAEADAGLEVEVLTPAGDLVFRAIYRGEYTVEQPFLTEDRIAEALAQAMSAAIQTAIQDPRFTSAFSGRVVSKR